MQTGKSFTAKGMEVLERVGKETMELLIEETGLEVEQSHDDVDQQAEEEQFEEVTFDRCFYIYGGPDQLEVLLFLLQLCRAYHLPLRPIFLFSWFFFPFSFFSCDRLGARNSKHCQATTHCCSTGGRQNYYLSKNHSTTENLRRSSRSSI